MRLQYQRIERSSTERKMWVQILLDALQKRRNLITTQLTGNYDFKQDLVVAQDTESEVSQLLLQHYGTKTLEFCNNKDYDLLVENTNGDIILIEIKEDFQCGKTSRLAVEIESWGRQSGLMTTSATHYIHKLHGSEGVEFWITTTEALKKLYDERKFPMIVNGGDKGSNSLNILFYLSVFKEVSKQLFV